MYLLLEGSVDVLKTTPFGEPYITASLLDSYHCSFGEMALIDKGTRSATIRAKTDCRTLCLDLRIPLFSESGDVPAYAAAESLSLETAARRLRYGFFRRLEFCEAVFHDWPSVRDGRGCTGHCRSGIQGLQGLAGGYA